MKMGLPTRVLLLCLVPLAALSAESTVLLRRQPGPLQAALLLGTLGVAALALLSVVLSVRTAEAPVGTLTLALQQAATTGELARLSLARAGTGGFDTLTESYDRAAEAVLHARRAERQTYVDWVASLAVAIDARDPYTAGHSLRVSQSASAVGLAMGLPAQTIERVRVGAVLHDLGKIGVGDAILQKDGPLTDDEAAQVRQHVHVGRSILAGMPGFAEYLDAVGQHHENWDGSGYPQGLRGEQTSVEARIIHVADAYDAMTRDRCYRQGVAHEAALSILWSFAGTQFDPAVVELFATLPAELLAGGRPGDAAMSGRELHQP